MSPQQLSPPEGFAERVVDAWMLERRALRRRWALIAAAAALISLGVAAWPSTPPPELRLTARVDRALPPGGGPATVMVEIHAEAHAPAPAALAVIIDASMDHARREALRRGLEALRATLAPEDALLVVTEAGVVGLDAHPTRDLHRAMTAAVEALTRRPAQRTLAVITDGGLDEALRLEAAAAWSEHQIRAVTIGLGDRFAPGPAHAIAALGRGRFYFARRPQQVHGLLRLELEAARHAALAEATLYVGEARLELGRLSAPRLALTPTRLIGPTEVRLEGRTPDGRRVTARIPLDVALSSDPRSWARRDPRVQAEVARRRASLALVAALAAREDGAPRAASEALARGRRALEALPPDAREAFEATARLIEAMPVDAPALATRYRAEASRLFDLQMGELGVGDLELDRPE